MAPRILQRTASAIARLTSDQDFLGHEIECSRMVPPDPQTLEQAHSL